MLIGTGILLLAGSPVRAQGNMPGALAKTTQLVTYGKALPNAGRIISSAEVGKSAAALLNAKRLPDQALAARVQRQVLRQTMEKGYFPGLYRPDYTQTQTVAYLRSVTKALSDLYPNTKRRFAPVTVSSFQELMDIWANGPKEEFMERMTESAKAVVDYFGKHITYVNVMRNMSVSCDCEGVNAEPVVTPNVGILSSTDILALDQACVDLVYAMTEAEHHDLVERIETRHGLRQLSYMKELGMGNDRYILIDLDNGGKRITPQEAVKGLKPFVQERE